LRKDKKRSLAPLTCALLAVIGYSALVGPILVSRGPGWFLHVGRRDTYLPTFQQIRHILGPDAVVAGSYSHDGREFWVLARDPLLLEAHRDISLLDRPVYRAARIAYPAAAAPWGLLGNTGLLVGLLITNLIVIAFGAYFTCLLAMHVRAPPIASIFFVASPVVALAMLMDLSDAMSLAALVASVYLFIRGRIGWATAAGVVAVLAKQPALLPMIALAACTPQVSRRLRLSYVAIPIAALLLWMLYAVLRLGLSGSSVVEFTLPFFGYIHSVPNWLRHRLWSDAAVGLGLLPAAGVVIVRWWHRRTPILTAALPFAVIVPFISYPVLFTAINSLRAFGPAITFFGVDWFEGRRLERLDTLKGPRGELTTFPEYEHAD
jgi:hypothetical protein